MKNMRFNSTINKNIFRKFSTYKNTFSITKETSSLPNSFIFSNSSIKESKSKKMPAQMCRHFL